MASSQAEKATKIDAMMEQASKALVSRDYFAAEKLASGALRRANQEQDFERMARILLPLQEARRLKRQLAIDTERVTVVTGEIPAGKSLTSGCYLITPPRVGETPVMRTVRFRTVGDITCTCPVLSDAATVDEILLETAVTRVTERGATRMDDQTSDASMELRKKEGYF